MWGVLFLSHPYLRPCRALRAVSGMLSSLGALEKGVEWGWEGGMAVILAFSGSWIYPRTPHQAVVQLATATE